MFNFGGGTTGGGFGAPSNTAGGFGSGTTGGTGFSFGSGGTTGGGFGATQPNTGGFGSTGTTQNTGFSFGAQPATNTGGFGGMNNTTSAFGQNKPFGTTGATTTGFSFGGNTQTQQQPQQGNTFGASGNPFGATGATNTGFGAPSTNTFGSTGTTQTSGFSFGSQPTGGTTTGGFGAGTTNPFGTTGTTTGGFGNTQPTTGTGFSFGSQPTTGTTGGGSLFGTQPTQNTGMGFGGNNTGMGMGNTGGPITPQSFPSFKPTEENNTSTNTKMIYYSITKMDPYKDKSFEEWRWYFTLASQGKLTQNPFSTPTTGTTTTGGFGQTQQPSSSFSFGNTGTTNTGFGNTGTMGGSSNTGFSFGGNQPTTQTGFGTANTGFGTTTNTGAFGTANTTAFGQNKPATTTTGFSFGSQPTTGTTGGLGFGSGQPTTTTGFAFGSNNTGTTNTTAGFGSAQPTSGFNFGGGSTTLAPLGGTTNTGNTGSGFNFGSAQPTTGTANTGSGFNFGGSTQPSTSSGFNFGTGTSGFGGGTTTGGLGTTTTAPTSGFNFGGGNLGATGATTAGSGFNFGGTTNTGTAGSSGFNFGTSTQPLGGTTSGFNFGTTGGAGLGLTTGFGGQPTNVAYGVAPMALPDLNNLLADPFGSNPLFQLQKEALEQSYAQEEESSVISKSIQKTSTQVRPRTFKKSSNNTLVDRMSLIATDTESATLDLLDSNSFTSKENVKELTISSAVFDKRSSQQLNQPRSNGTTSERDESQKTINSNTIRPKPQKGKAISLDIEQSPKETTVKPNFLPKLTREGYYTKPSFEEMKKMSQQDLQNCNGFTVGRKGYGEVEFLGVTDLTRNLDLDKIIYEIETNHVEVYSSNVYTEKTKPSVGTELNKPTIVKLFNVHSKNNDIKLFERKLRKANERSGSKFIDYVNGQWTFKVEHFTKYGIFDDEEDEEEIIENEEEEKQEPFQVVKSINLDEISDSSEDEIIEEEEIIDNEDEDDDVMQIESHRTFLPRQLNLDPRRMYIMQANLMADDEAADDNNINFEAIRQTKKPRFKEIAESEPTLAFVKKDAPVQPIKPRKYIDSTPSNIVGDPEAESTHRDSLFSLSRSFRVGFLPNGQLIVPTIVFNPKSRVSNISVSEFFVKEDKKVPQTQESEYLKLKYESKVHMEIEHSERDPNDLHISLNNNSYTKLMEGHVQKCEKLINSVDHFNFSDATKQLIVNREKFELSAWKLVHLLFGEVEMLDGNDYATDIARKRNLSSWIREQIPIEEIINRVNPKPLEKIYLLLSSGRIAEAARVALENKDVRLSSIISQSFSNPFMQKDIQKQINLWKQAKANIDKDLIKIYELLAGNVCDTSLTWLQCLGLHLWYKNSPDTTISQVFASYTNYFETSRSTKPFLSSSRYSSETHYDLRYHVLGMYCKKEIPISSSLEPSTYVDDILDCQLTWHLYNVLRRVTSCDTTGSMSHIINCNYALQLEQAGYPQYALFVLCHSDLTPNISDDINRELNQDKSNSLVSKFKRERLVDVRNRAIREILFRNYPILMTNESGMKFIKELQISPNWIYEAAALYARYTCSYQLLFENLCHYHNYVEAHKVFLEYILSDLLLCNKYEELTKYIQKLYDHQVLIPNWSKGGDILYRYICVRKQFETLEAHIEGNSTIFTDSSNIKTTYDALSKLDVEITELLDLVKHLTLYTLEHRVAVSDTTVKITNMMVKVKSLLTVYEADTDYNEMIQEDSNQKEQCLFNVASVTQNVYLTNQIDLLQTLALSTTFNLQ